MGKVESDKRMGKLIQLFNIFYFKFLIPAATLIRLFANSAFYKSADCLSALQIPKT